MDDAVTWEEFLSHREAIKFFSPFDDAKEYAREWMEKQVFRYQRDGFGLFAVLENGSGQFVGQCGLMIQEVDGVNEIEIGYHLLPRFWKYGYATEAAMACKIFAFENEMSDSLISIIDKRNLASVKVAERNGMKLDKQTVWRDIEVFIYRIRKIDMKAESDVFRWA